MEHDNCTRQFHYECLQKGPSWYSAAPSILAEPVVKGVILDNTPTAHEQQSAHEEVMLLILSFLFADFSLNWGFTAA